MHFQFLRNCCSSVGAPITEPLPFRVNGPLLFPMVGREPLLKGLLRLRVDAAILAFTWQVPAHTVSNPSQTIVQNSLIKLRA